ncbi:MAG: glycosyltransferase family 39 protein [Candidatus Handelsmanbacteria bacterium]|nr:glycosyltransferase family 39 protein [Candidatus Handelsmanbacteria bacterium]
MRRPRLPGVGSSPSLLALLALALHLETNLLGGYGYFRDELYYIACSERLDWGYVDHPPLSILLLRLSRLLLGDSLFGLRLLPALAGAGLVWLTALLTRELGGGQQAETLAALGVLIAPICLGLGDFYSMNAFEPLCWTGCTLLLVRLVRGEEPRRWLYLGALAGLGLQNKHSLAFFAGAALLGLLLTPQRRLLFSPWCWMGMGLALLLILPNLLWQHLHDWPTLEFLLNAQAQKNYLLSPLEYLLAQMLYQHPLALPLWAAGALALLLHPRLREFRCFGIAFIALLAFFVIQRGKPYYLSPIFPLLLAAGAVAAQWHLRPRWLNTYTLLLALGGALTLPLALPLLPPQPFIRYAAYLGLGEVKTERHGVAALPQHLADRFGWPELAASVTQVYRSLSPEEQHQTALYTQNYGEAGALEFYGRPQGLPPVLCGHNNYWLWGQDPSTPQVLIAVGGHADNYRAAFGSVEQVALHTHEYAMPYERDLPLFLCRDPLLPLAKLWPAAKRYL